MGTTELVLMIPIRAMYWKESDNEGKYKHTDFELISHGPEHF